MTTVTIQINDETNCKLIGLDTHTRNKLVKKFKYEIPGARFTPACKLGRWDGMKSFMQLGGSTFINLLPEILPILIDDGYEIEVVDTREYNTTFTFDIVTEDSYSHIKWPKGHDREGQPIILRDYQVEAINLFLENPQSIQIIATGAGKTITSAVLSHKCEPYGRTVVVVPSKDLVIQTEADYINMGLDVGVFFGTRKEYNKTHTICTWQSLNSMFKATKAGEAVVEFSDFINGVVCVMVDEAHTIRGDSLQTLLTTVMAKIPIRWAFTGTLPKAEADQRSLQVSVGGVIGGVSAKELQDKGVLSNCQVHIKQLIDYTEYKNYQDELRYLLDNEPRISAIAEMVVEIAKTGNTLVLIDRVDPGKMLAAAIPNAVFLSGASKSDKRKEQYDSIAVTDGTTTVCTYGISAVGINIPRIFNLILIEPGKSFVRVIQSIGRGLRKAEDKDFVNIYDITSTCKFSKRHLTARKKFYDEAGYKFDIKKINWQ